MTTKTSRRRMTIIPSLILPCTPARGYFFITSLLKSFATRIKIGVLRREEGAKNDLKGGEIVRKRGLSGLGDGPVEWLLQLLYILRGWFAILASEGLAEIFGITEAYCESNLGNGKLLLFQEHLRFFQPDVADQINNRQPCKHFCLPK